MQKWKTHLYLGITSIITGVFFSIFMLVILPQISPFTQFDALVRSSGSFFFIISGIITIRKALNHKKDKS